VTRTFRIALAIFVTSCLAAATPAAAQTGRAAGLVRDSSGHPLRGVIVRATNPQAHPAEVTSTTDSRGRWAMIGLSGGTWKFDVEATGYLAAGMELPVRSAGTPPVTFTLTRDPGPIPGALDKKIDEQLSDANSLRDQGRFDQAIMAYQDIRLKNPKLSTVNLVLADTYRRKAAQEKDPAARRALLDIAVNTYADLLKTDADNERAKLEIESTRAQAATGLTK
jgi:carboxypeptidase family protein